MARRTVLQAAAWSAPVAAAAVAVPAHASSPELKPGITVTTGGSPWDDNGTYKGYIAEGIAITLADATGKPLPVGTTVTLTLSKPGKPNDWAQDNFWFVPDPKLSAADATKKANQLRTISLTITSPGLLMLYPTSTTGYLRKGSNGEKDGTALTVTAGGASTQVIIVNSSSAGGKNPGVKPA